jgi:hypothetical protein
MCIFIVNSLSGGIFIKQIRKSAAWLISFAMGLLLAIAFSFSENHILTLTGASYIQNIYGLMNLSVSPDFLIYILFCRGIPFLLLIMLTAKTGRQTFILIYLFYCGFSYGAEAVLLTFYIQWQAVIVISAQLFPQILCYVPALYIVCIFCTEHPVNRKQLLFAGIFLWTCGMLAESYLNPYVIKFCMKVML